MTVVLYAFYLKYTHFVSNVKYTEFHRFSLIQVRLNHGICGARVSNQLTIGANGDCLADKVRQLSERLANKRNTCISESPLLNDGKV